MYGFVTVFICEEVHGGNIYGGLLIEMDCVCRGEIRVGYLVVMEKTTRGRRLVDSVRGWSEENYSAGG